MCQKACGLSNVLKNTKLYGCSCIIRQYWDGWDWMEISWGAKKPWKLVESKKKTNWVAAACHPEQMGRGYNCLVKIWARCDIKLQGNNYPSLAIIGLICNNCQHWTTLDHFCIKAHLYNQLYKQVPSTSHFFLPSTSLAPRSHSSQHQTPLLSKRTDQGTSAVTWRPIWWSCIVECVAKV